MDHDWLYVSGSAALGGTLNVSRLNNYLPAVDAVFALLSSTSRSGTFATINGLVIDATRAFQPVYDDTGFSLRVVPI